MSWLSNLTPPGIKNIFKKEDDGASALWVKCTNCGEMMFRRDLEAAQNVCSSCGHHMRVTVADRLSYTFDDGEYDAIILPEPALDPLKFKDERRYVDRLKDSRRKTEQQDAMYVAKGKIDGLDVVCAVQNFDFMGGSMGMALGEALLTAAETAVEHRTPLIVFTASGGARMQEGILSLMQMPRTTIAVQMMREAGLPFLVVITHPTTGGVTASYAMLGDIHLAEPGALIGFAGPRVIEQTIREKLPEGFQRSEFLYDKGMVDLVVHRHEMKATLAQLIRVLTNHGLATARPEADPKITKQADASASPETAPSAVAANDTDGEPAEADSDESGLDKAAE
ncbi:MAG: acetyl-CoA carboxylase, carboxyltransferase subunit beta [Pseudomonadota bacterium]